MEPIGIVLKTDRKGLGRDAALKEIREFKKSLIRSRQSVGPSVCEYRERRAQEAAEKLDLSDLLRCQRVCRQMDLEQVGYYISIYIKCVTMPLNNFYLIIRKLRLNKPFFKLYKNNIFNKILVTYLYKNNARNNVKIIFQKILF